MANNSRNRFLVIARIGDHPDHQEWIKPSKDKNFDLCISYYGDERGKYKNESDFYFESKGNKWPELKEVILRLGDQINRYDAVWFPSEGIRTNASTINRMFHMFSEHKFELAQPAMTKGSVDSYPATLQHSYYLWRYCSFVDITAPIFSRNALTSCWNTFDLNDSGWGLDLLWPKLLHYPDKKIAIIDETPVTYIRNPSTHGHGSESENDLKEIEKNYSVSASVYTQPQYEGVLKDRNIFFVILAHDNEDILIEQVFNIQHFNPEAGIILYNGGTDPDFAKSLCLPICTYSRPVQWSRSARVFWDVMRWIEKMDVNYNYLVNFDHDMLFIKTGFEEFLEKTMQNFDCMGWQLLKGSEPETFPAPEVPKSLWKEWEVWQPILRTDDFLRYFNPGQVYRRGIIQRMLNHLKSVGDGKVSRLLDETQVHTLDEMLYVTLAMVCGGKYREYPDGEQYNEAVRWGKDIRLHEMKSVQKHSSYYWIHPVKQKNLIKLNKSLLSRTGQQRTIKQLKKNVKKQRGNDRRVRAPELYDCHCHLYQHTMLGATEVLGMLIQATNKKDAFSLTRFSHAEISYLNWRLNPILIKNYEKFRQYSGMTGAIETVANELLHSMDSTDLVGFVPEDCKDNGKWWYSNTRAFLHHFNRMPEKICSVWVPQELIHLDAFWNFLKEHRVALIGRRAPEAAPCLKQKGVQTTVIRSLEGIEEIDTVHEELINDKEWDIALISAAIPATLLTPRLARNSGRIVLDFGHAMDMIVEAENYDFYKYFEEWNRKHIRKKRR